MAADILSLVNDDISTHALTEGDYILHGPLHSFAAFQLTPSRRATQSKNQIRMVTGISTHALTEGDIVEYHLLFGYKRYFNSRPHGGRLQI